MSETITCKLCGDEDVQVYTDGVCMTCLCPHESEDSLRCPKCGDHCSLPSWFIEKLPEGAKHILCDECEHTYTFEIRGETMISPPRLEEREVKQ